MLSCMYGAFIASVRRSRGLTQAQLAEVSGVQQSNISAIEQDRRQPSAATLHRLVHACGFELLASAGEQSDTPTSKSIMVAFRKREAA